MRFFLVLLLFSFNSFTNSDSSKFFIDCIGVGPNADRMGRSLYRFNNSEGLVAHRGKYFGDKDTYRETIYNLVDYDDKTYVFVELVNSRNRSLNTPNENLIIDRSSLDISRWHYKSFNINESCRLISEESYWEFVPIRPKNQI